MLCPHRSRIGSSPVFAGRHKECRTVGSEGYRGSLKKIHLKVLQSESQTGKTLHPEDGGISNGEREP